MKARSIFVFLAGFLFLPAFLAVLIVWPWQTTVVVVSACSVIVCAAMGFIFLQIAHPCRGDSE